MTLRTHLTNEPRKGSAPRITQLPNDAPADPAVGLKEATNVLDAAVWPTEASWSVPRAPASRRRLRARLQALRPTRIVLAATGEDEPAVATLPGLPLVVVNPRPARDFARAGAVRA